MTTESYVRDNRFETICLGWLTPTGRGWLGAAEIPQFLARFDWSSTAVLVHHGQFDGLILSHHYGVHPCFFYDTMAMGRVLHPTESMKLENLGRLYGLGDKSVPYNELDGLRLEDIGPGLVEKTGQGAIQDCQLTLTLFERMKPHFPPEELAIIDMTVQMFSNPKFIGDAAGFRSLVQAERDEKERLLARLGVTAEDLRKSKAGDARLKELLEAEDVEVEYKTTKAGNTIPAFAAGDEFMQELCMDENEPVRLLAETRLAIQSNIKETRAERLAGMAERGPLPVYLNYFGASRTSRWSGGDRVNWQNFPRRTVEESKAGKPILGDCRGSPWRDADRLRCGADRMQDFELCRRTNRRAQCIRCGARHLC
jgi:hypothetical protein